MAGARGGARGCAQRSAVLLTRSGGHVFISTAPRLTEPAAARLAGWCGAAAPPRRWRHHSTIRLHIQLICDKVSARRRGLDGALAHCVANVRWPPAGLSRLLATAFLPLVLALQRLRLAASPSQSTGSGRPTGRDTHTLTPDAQLRMHDSVTCIRDSDIVGEQIIARN